MMMAQVCDGSAQEALCERAVCSGSLDMNEFLHAILPKDYVNLAVKITLHLQAAVAELGGWCRANPRKTIGATGVSSRR